MATKAQTLVENPLQAQTFPKIREILYATDFSAASLAALPFAAAMAQTFNSRIHLLHLLMTETYQFLPPEGMPAAVGAIERTLGSECSSYAPQER